MILVYYISRINKVHSTNIDASRYCVVNDSTLQFCPSFLWNYGVIL